MQNVLHYFAIMNQPDNFKDAALKDDVFYHQDLKGKTPLKLAYECQSDKTVDMILQLFQDIPKMYLTKEDMLSLIDFTSPNVKIAYDTLFKPTIFMDHPTNRHFGELNINMFSNFVLGLTTDDPNVKFFESTGKYVWFKHPKDLLFYQ